MAWHEKVGRLSDPSPEEFKEWVTVKGAFSHLITGVDKSLSDALLNRLKTGMLFGGATTAKWQAEGGQKLTKYITAIDPTWWSNVDGGRQDHYDRLWKHGDITLFVPDRDEGTNALVHFFDVRFEWSGLHEIVQPPFRLTPPDRPAPPLPTNTAVVSASDENRHSGPLSAEEYDRWTFAPHALRVLAGVADEETLIQTIHSHLEDGLIRAVAETMKVSGGTQTWTRCLINPQYWIEWACLADQVFWQTGNREVFGDTEPCRKFRLAPVRMYRVRFHPEDLEKLRPPPLIAATPRPVQISKAPPPIVPLRLGYAATEPEVKATQARPRKATRPRKRLSKTPVTHAEFKGWFDALSKADQDKGYRWLWDQSRRHFHPRRVLKKYATEIVEGRDLGRKPKT